MADPLPHLKIVLDALREGLARPEVRAAMSELGRWLIAVAESGAAPSSPPQSAPASDVMSSPPSNAANPTPPPALRPTVLLEPRMAPITGPAVAAKLKIGDSNPMEVVTRGSGVVSTRALTHEPVPPPPIPRRAEAPDLPDLKRVAGSARLKAEACLAAADGRNTQAFRDEILALREAEGPFDGGLWMCSWLDGPGRARAAQAAPAYRALAGAAELGAFLTERDQLHPGRPLEEPFQHMAQAQSMVRNFIEDGRGEDRDQLDLFHWLRTLTSEHHCRVRVGRYMRRDDMASPSDAPAVLASITSLHESMRARLDGEKERRRLIGKVRHKAGLLATAGAIEAAELWRDLERVQAALLSDGVKFSDPELVAALSAAPEPASPVSEQLAESLRLARAATARRAEDADEEDEEALSHEVAEAARLLRGRVMVLVGGEVKPNRREAIERAFGLRELRWLAANMNDASTDSFEPHLRRPETALVVRMVRFTRTNHGELLDLCKRHGRAFVNLPAGYGVNQLATEILAQAATQLGSLPPAE